MTQSYEPIRSITPITAPLALRDSGDIDRFNEAAERNLAEMKAMTDDLNADFIPKINGVRALVNNNLDAIKAAPEKADAAAASARNAAASEENAATSETNAAASAITAEGHAADAHAAADRAEAVTGATPEAEPGTVVARDMAGRAQVADPVDPLDATNKRYVDMGIFFPGQITPYHGSMDETGAHPLVNGTARTDWRLCDGEDGTPDLRDRFVTGAGGTRVAGDTGGAENTATSAVANHTHTGGIIGATTLTESQIPVHTHTYVAKVDLGSGNFQNNQLTYGSGSNKGTSASSSVGGGSSHTHTNGATGASGGHSHAVDVLPPYYALCYIMKL